MKTLPTPAPASNPEQLSDSALLASATAGNPLAFECIMRRHNRLLLRIARNVLKNGAETEDALQEAYLRAWHALKAFRADAKLSTWLVRIVINESLGRLRRPGAQVIPQDGSADRVEPQPEATLEGDLGRQPHNRAMRAEVRRLLEARIDLLPGVDRTVFMLRAVEELNVDETMKKSNITWSEQTLDRFLTKPLKMVPGSAMTYDGVANPKDRADLIAYLKHVNQTLECAPVDALTNAKGTRHEHPSSMGSGHYRCSCSDHCLWQQFPRQLGSRASCPRRAGQADIPLRYIWG